MKNSNVVRSRLIILINEEINEANWMVSNSAKLDRRTKQHTQFGVSASNGSRDMGRTKVAEKKRKKNEHRQSHKASPTGIANNNNNNDNNNNNNNETGSRSLCMRPNSEPPKMKNSNVVRSRLIILINEEINEANWMVSNSAKLDRRTKQHTQFGVSASNGSRDMAWTKSWRKKRKKLKEKN